MNKVLKFLSLSVLVIIALSIASFAHANVCLDCGPTAFAQSDTENPSDVENLTAEAFNGAVILNWDSATDDTGIAGYQVHYGLSPVLETGETYDQTQDVGNVLSYTVEGLQNGSTYYFSVVAYDAAGNESLSWAPEASATPLESLSEVMDDTDPPQVSGAEAINVEQVKVMFSEAVKLPSEFPEDSFVIENTGTFEMLNVLGAEIDADDISNKTVLLNTAQQETGVEYMLTVGTSVSDLAGNPISSGTADTALFTGSNLPKPAEDITPPKLVSIQAVDNTHIRVTFDEAIVLSIDPAQNFNIVAEDNPTVSLDVIAVELESNQQGVEDAVALIRTGPQENRMYLLVVADLEDEAGNVVNPSQTSGTFYGKSLSDETEEEEEEEEEEEVLVLSDVTNFVAKKLFEAGGYVVELSWNALVDNSSIIKQMLYISSNKGASYSEKDELAPDATEYEISGLESGEYWFKLTQVDSAGNESAGVVAKVTLAETGPELFGLLLVSVGLGGFFRKKRE